MHKATNAGTLNEIPKCKITIPNAGTIVLNNLPDISDSKQAVYNPQPIIGRSFPLYTYSHSGDRTINMQLHFFIVNPGDAQRNLSDLRKIQSAVYPRRGDNTPYKPPPICTIECNQILANDEPLCAALQSYSVRFPTDVAWDTETYCPYRFDVDTQWWVVYTSTDLPYQDRIVTSGR